MCHEVCFQIVLHFIILTTKTAHHIRETFMQNCYFGSKDDGYDANWLPLWLEKLNQTTGNPADENQGS